MPSTTMQPRSRLTGASGQEGPVLLATKPFNGLDAPVAVARWIAAREDRELRVVSVLEPVDTTFPAGLAPLPSRCRDDERAALAAQIRLELESKGALSERLHVDVLHGPSAETVVASARECDARVIVVGTGRHDQIGRYIYGERALQIVARADRPVVVVPSQAMTTPLSVAVVAADFSPASVRAAVAVLPLLAPGGRLVVVHVKPGVTLNEETAGWWNDGYERRCADLFAQFLRRLPRPPGITLESKFLRGDVVPTLLHFAATRGARLVACGRLGHSPIARVLVGSVSSALIRQATVPVLVAPELPGDAALR